MNFRAYRSRVSLLALSTAALLVVQPDSSRAQAVSSSQLQEELNGLQGQINSLKAQQRALNGQQAVLQTQARRQAIVTEQQAQVAKQQAMISHEQLLASSRNQWYATGSKPSPEFVTKNGKSAFTIGGQVEVDAGLGSVPGQRGFSGGTNFRRVEFYIEGVYDEHFLYKVENDWTKTTTPLGGLLDVYMGYQHKLGRFDNVFLAGNQHTPFGFQTASDATLFLENEMGSTLFQDNRQLGLTGQTYNKNLNFWYGVTGTNNGTQSSAATSTTTIDTGSTHYNSEYTASTVMAWNIFNTPGHLLSVRNSVAYNRFNAAFSTANEPTFSTTPDLNVYGAKFITTGALPIQSMLVESPRIDFEDNRLTLAAVYYDATTQSNAIVSKKNPINFQPHFSSWDIEGEYFLTDDHEPFSDYHGYYESVKVKNPVTAGGPGAIQLAARVDEANLNDAKYGIHGGNETNLTLGVNWWPTSYTRVNLNYVKMFPIGGGKLVVNNDQSANIVALRLEFIY
jgi:phosphate-selective porin OprO and OprP